MAGVYVSSANAADEACSSKSEQPVVSPGCQTSLRNEVQSERAGGRIADRVAFTPLPRNNGSVATSDAVRDALAQNAVQVKQCQRPAGHPRKGRRLRKLHFQTFESAGSTSTATGTPRTTRSLSILSAEEGGDGGGESGVDEIGAGERRLVQRGQEDKPGKASTLEELPLHRGITADNPDQQWAQAWRNKNKTEGDLPRDCSVSAAGEQVLPPPKPPGRLGRRPLGQDLACLLSLSAPQGGSVSSFLSVISSGSDQESDGHHDASAQVQQHARQATSEVSGELTFEDEPRESLSHGMAVGELAKAGTPSESSDRQAGWCLPHLEKEKKEEDQDEEDLEDDGNDEDGYLVSEHLEVAHFKFAKSRRQSTPGHVGTMSAVTTIVGNCQTTRKLSSPGLRLPALASAGTQQAESILRTSSQVASGRHDRSNLMALVSSKLQTQVVQRRPAEATDRPEEARHTARTKGAGNGESGDHDSVPKHSGQRLLHRPAQLATAAEPRPITDQGAMCQSHDGTSALGCSGRREVDSTAQIDTSAVPMVAAAEDLRDTKQAMASGDSDASAGLANGTRKSCKEAMGNAVAHARHGAGEDQQRVSQASDDECPVPVRSRRERGQPAELAAAAEARALSCMSRFTAGDLDGNAQLICGSTRTSSAQKHVSATATGTKPEKTADRRATQESDNEFPVPVRSRKLRGQPAALAAAAEVRALFTCSSSMADDSDDDA
eukprot:TRINITY_DN9490_c0_g1_i2.p1 TRINITY_DN9490_c0_g1~~TRINITY_DN9490_c0_g1_i2.p1  ORF type:complete len:721 (-),score=146.20 TRINITY_DN9490_c0_g1_i2:175-2337(-)